MYHVIIADDDPVVGKILRSLVDWDALGFHLVSVVSDGSEVQKEVERCTPDLILCDLEMPDFDALALIRQMRAQNLKTEILVLAEYRDYDKVCAAIRLGAFDYSFKGSIHQAALSSQLLRIRKRLDAGLGGTQPVPLTEEQHAVRLEQHEAWREFFTQKSYSLETLVKITGIRSWDYEPLTLCQVSFERYVKDHKTLPAADLIRRTFQFALEHLERRRVVLISASDILLILPEEELEQHQETPANLATHITHLFEYYLSLTPEIVYKSGIPDLPSARDVYQDLLDVQKLSFYHPLGRMNAHGVHLRPVVPGPSYRDLASEILACPTETVTGYTEKRLKQILDECEKQNTAPAAVLRYCVRLLNELNYQSPALSTGSHDRLMTLIEEVREATGREGLLELLGQALQVILRPSAVKAEDLGLTDSDSWKNYSPEILEVLSYVRENYSHKISLATAADHVGLSSGYLCRIFKEETGISIGKYINQFRMATAAELLKNPHLYIKEIALSVGYDDQLYFTRMFKRRFGMTPTEYRVAIHL